MTLLDIRSVGGGLYNLRRVSLASLGRVGRRRTETPAGHDSAVNEQRFAWLLDLCADDGLTVEYVDLGPRRHGQYLRRHRRIELNRNLNLRQLVPGLGHEYAHHVYNDGCSTTFAERRAWEYAAQLLIAPEEYAAAERIVGHSVQAIALELDLTPVLVEAWRRWWRTASLANQPDDAWGA
ncbi:hypothetical protein FBY23_0017 [Nocardioides sp. SLBN-35]|nr:hypothetical protein FBY23_0017 [Nocardioides sp. SLBN-35]